MLLFHAKQHLVKEIFSPVSESSKNTSSKLTNGADKLDSKREKDEETDNSKEGKLEAGAAEEKTAEVRITRSTRHKSSEAVNNGHNSNSSEDENSDGDQKASHSRSQSRIDKWKAKHEAMLKLATTTEKKKKKKASRKETEEEPEEEEQQQQQQQQEEEEEMEAETEKKQEQEEEEEDKKDSEPELPDIEPTNGVCIDLEENGKKDSAASGSASAPGKPHTRHSAAVQQQQQQALSV